MNTSDNKTISAIQQDLIDNFNLFDDWLGKYEFLIDLGKTLPPYSDEDKQEQYKVQGCQSNVWIRHCYNNNKITFTATSDSAIVCGLIYLLLTIFNDHTPEQIINAKPIFIERIGLDRHLSMTRKNGLYAMLQAIKHIASGYID